MFIDAQVKITINLKTMSTTTNKFKIAYMTMVLNDVNNSHCKSRKIFLTFNKFYLFCTSYKMKSNVKIKSR